MHYSASKFLKIHIFDSKVDTDAVLDGHTISEHFLSRKSLKRDQPDARHCVSEESECIFHKEEEQIEECFAQSGRLRKRLFRSQFFKNAHCVETFETAKRPLSANLRRRVLSHHLRKKEWVPLQNCFQNVLKLQTPKNEKIGN